MASWRLGWFLEEISKPANYRKHSQTLRSPWKFWLGMLAKVIPRIWRGPIKLELKEGGAFDVREFMTLYIYREIFIDKCYDREEFAADKPVIVDVGANTGLFAIRMKQLFPDSEIHCFEPFPPNFEQLRKNLEQSRLTGYEILNKGVGGKARTEKLYIHSKNIGGHSIYQEETDGSNYIEVELLDLRSVVDRLNGKRCNLLKLDCEGAEFEIIKSIDREMAQKIAHIIFEASYSQYDFKELNQHLTGLGYQVGKFKGMHVADLIKSYT